MEDEIKLSKDMLKTMSVDTRASILKSLEAKQMTASEISRVLNKHVTTVSEHLSLLQSSGLVERIERPGHKWIYYRLTKNADRILHPKVYYRWAIILSLSVVVFVGTMVSSTNALPGDPLYGLKRSIETVQLLAAGTEYEKARLHLENAEKRLDEAKAVAIKNKTAAAETAIIEYAKEIIDADKQLEIERRNGKDVGDLLEKVVEDTSRHISILENIKDRRPDLENEIESTLEISRESHDKSKDQLEKLKAPQGK